MIKRLFLPADILIPDKIDMPLWSVVACDQFTSQVEYWDEIDRMVNTMPSALRLMFPEAYFGLKDVQVEAKKANECMIKYINNGVFNVVKDSFVYIERTLNDGNVRKGLLGAFDLEYYDYKINSTSPVHATEGTIEDRLPPRVNVRMGAALEMPHVIIFFDDPSFKVIEPLYKEREKFKKLYDFELMAGGGHIQGRQICSERSELIIKELEKLSNTEELTSKYGSQIKYPIIFAVGDGNHSLATAKKCWEELKNNLSAEERKSHPARYSLAEIVNIHDESIRFEPIHRVIFNTDTSNFIARAENFWRSTSKNDGEVHNIKYITKNKNKNILIKGLTIGELIALNDEFLKLYIISNKGKIDYIHGDKVCLDMAMSDNCVGAMMPKMKKSELFSSVMKSGIFPKKSFSIGDAKDKRYYLECRKIK